ncbi:Formate/nitrite family of transporter [Rozella allomycis CSF55]|uniref:Formate/nitrite family of transporter n=1 Tax=Rozella allomycis (strain CSF55) TaxID=988480 RepID=A0A4P9YD02_ROZAC|nr:Formate/nitrite family of transporter [Rozella allomycis CSF55]
MTDLESQKPASNDPFINFITPPQTYNNQHDTVELLFKNAIGKCSYSPLVTLINGFLAATGGFFSIIVGGGFDPSFSALYPAVPKVTGGFAFSLALILIVFLGGELFTGNTMVLALGLFGRRVSYKKVLINWPLVLLGNVAGCIFMAYFFGYLTEIFKMDPFLTYLVHLTEKKCRLAVHVIFLRAIPANALVCMAIVLGTASRDLTGKFLALVFPVVAFAAIGFEHSIANSFYLSQGWMYGADAEGAFVNFFVALLGNIVGGALFVAGSQYFIYKNSH